MKIFLLMLMIVFSAIIPQVYAACLEDSDWPEKPCFDNPPHTLEEKQSAWELYYEYKGESWMEQKKQEMFESLERGNIQSWINDDKTGAHENIWEYYYYQGIVPDPEIEPYDDLSKGIIFCIEGYRQVGPECVPDDSMKIFAYEIFYLVFLIIVVAIFSVMIFMWWRRK